MRLPREYKGYSTLELLDVFERIPGLKAAHEPKDKIRSMRELMREYRLAPVMWESKEDGDRAREMIAELYARAGEACARPCGGSTVGLY